MKKCIVSFIAASCCMLLTGCGSLKSYWYCYVDAIGEEPANKTYFAEPRFPQEVNPLVAKEYMSKLEITLSHLGYTKVDSANAALKLAFGYQLGDIEERAYTYSTPVYQYIPPTSTTTKSTITNKDDKTVGSVKSTTSTDNNKYGTVAYSGERTNTAYETRQTISITLDAFDVKTKEPVWSIRVDDKTDPASIQNLRNYMPYYLLNMFPYIGKNSGSRKYSQVYLNDERLNWFAPQIQQ